jgi:hypothetical protein
LTKRRMGVVIDGLAAGHEQGAQEHCRQHPRTPGSCKLH